MTERLQEFEYPLWILIDMLYSVWIFDKFEHAVIFAECQSFIGSELEVQIYLLEEEIHQLDYLKDQLILAHIITMLVYDAINLGGIIGLGLARIILFLIVKVKI